MSQRVAIVGYGIEGRSACRYFVAQGADITVFHKERPADLPLGVKLEQNRPSELRGYDVVVRSPKVNPSRLSTDGRLTTVTNEFLAVFGTERVIGVTGSKGKGTTASLIYEMLKSAGKQVHLGGNIGVPALDLLSDTQGGSDWAVLELSSFQLWDLTVSPHVAVVGMITPDHLDIHDDLDDYVSAKANIARHQRPNDIIIYHPTNLDSKKIADQSPAIARFRFATIEAAHVEGADIIINGQKICAVSDVQIPGRHNLENICAALTAAWQITQDIEALGRAIRQYKGLEHRIEFVRTVDDVDYYDDSFAASTSAAVVAAQAFDAPKVMILGGFDRGIDLEPMVRGLAETNLRKVLLIGQTASKLAELFVNEGRGEQVEIVNSESMADIVAQARSAAQPGDVVVLSPGSASFDMFKDYKDRGNQFKEAVRAL